MRNTWRAPYTKISPQIQKIFPTVPSATRRRCAPTPDSTWPNPDTIGVDGDATFRHQSVRANTCAPCGNLFRTSRDRLCESALLRCPARSTDGILTRLAVFITVDPSWDGNRHLRAQRHIHVRRGGEGASFWSRKVARRLWLYFSPDACIKNRHAECAGKYPRHK